MNKQNKNENKNNFILFSIIYEYLNFYFYSKVKFIEIQLLYLSVYNVIKVCN